MILVTGAASGLGRYLHESLGGEGLTRANAGEVIGRLRRTGADVIIHAAFNPAKEIDGGSLYEYLRDNLFLTEEIASIPHKKFIFMSTVDVYAKDGRTHTEDEDIDVNPANGLYAMTKLMSEAIVRKRSADYLIIRASALLGKYSRKNSLIKILENDGAELTLSGGSRFNYVLHSAILEFIETAVETGLGGIYNAASTGGITLGEAAAIADRRVRFGSYEYDGGNVSSGKIAAVCPAFRKSSADVAREFIREFIKERG